MLNRRYTVALESFAYWTERLAAAEEKINALRIEQLRNERARQSHSTSHSSAHVTPLKQPPKK